MSSNDTAFTMAAMNGRGSLWHMLNSHRYSVATTQDYSGPAMRFKNDSEFRRAIKRRPAFLAEGPSL